MLWQLIFFEEVVGRLPPSCRAELKGSTLTPTQVDGWSDLDLGLWLGESLDLEVVLGPRSIWAIDEAIDSRGQVVRVVLDDGRRVDLSVEGPGRLMTRSPVESNSFRFLAAQAAVKLARGDRLIGLHLLLELCRLCLVQAMVWRDRESGTTVHRYGTARDALAAEVQGLLELPLTVTPRPNAVESAAALYDRWRQALDPHYRPDWSGLDALLERGTAPARKTAASGS